MPPPDARGCPRTPLPLEMGTIPDFTIRPSIREIWARKGFPLLTDHYHMVSNPQVSWDSRIHRQNRILGSSVLGLLRFAGSEDNLFILRQPSGEIQVEFAARTLSY